MCLFPLTHPSSPTCHTPISPRSLSPISPLHLPYISLAFFFRVFDSKLVAGRVDGDADEALRARFAVEEAPTLLLFPPRALSAGTPPRRFQGALESEAVSVWVRREFQKEGSKLEGSKKEGSKQVGSQKEGSKLEGSKKEGSKQVGSQKEGSKQEGSQKEGSKKEAQRSKTHKSHHEERASDERSDGRDGRGVGGRIGGSPQGADAVGVAAEELLVALGREGRELEGGGQMDGTGGLSELDAQLRRLLERRAAIVRGGMAPPKEATPSKETTRAFEQKTKKQPRVPSSAGGSRAPPRRVTVDTDGALREVPDDRAPGGAVAVEATPTLAEVSVSAEAFEVSENGGGSLSAEASENGEGSLAARFEAELDLLLPEEGFTLHGLHELVAAEHERELGAERARELARASAGEHLAAEGGGLSGEAQGDVGEAKGDGGEAQAVSGEAKGEAAVEAAVEASVARAERELRERQRQQPRGADELLALLGPEEMSSFEEDLEALLADESVFVDETRTGTRAAQASSQLKQQSKQPKEKQSKDSKQSKQSKQPPKQQLKQPSKQPPKQQLKQPPKQPPKQQLKQPQKQPPKQQLKQPSKQQLKQPSKQQLKQPSKQQLKQPSKAKQGKPRQQVPVEVPVPVAVPKQDDDDWFVD